MRQAASVISLLALLSACASTGSASPSVVPTVLPSALASAPPLAAGPLAPGRYASVDFEPALLVEVGEGWEVFHFGPEFFDVGRETDTGFSAIMFIRPTRFMGPAEGSPAGTPDEAIALLRQNEGLEVSDARPVEMDGHSGVEVDIAASNEDTQVLGGTDGILGIGPTNDVRLAFFEAVDAVLVIGLTAPSGEMGEWARTAQPVLESIRVAW